MATATDENMTIIKRFDSAPADCIENLRNLIAECEGDFLPPLSERYREDGDAYEPHDVSPYMLRFLKRPLFIAFDGTENIVGCLSYKNLIGMRISEHSELDELSLDVCCDDTMYITTICVSGTARKMGIASKLYDAFDLYAKQIGAHRLSVKTWSTNTAHLGLLTKRGFEQTAVLKDDRGEGTDTIFLTRRI